MRAQEFVTEQQADDFEGFQEAVYSWMANEATPEDMSLILNSPYSEKFRRPPAGISKLYRAIFPRDRDLNTIKSRSEIVAFATRIQGAIEFVHTLGLDYDSPDARWVIIGKPFNAADFLLDFSAMAQHYGLDEGLEEYEVWMRGTPQYRSANKKEVVLTSEQADMSEAAEPRGGIDVEHHEDAEQPNIVWITATTHGRELGRVKFLRQGDRAVALDLAVKPQYQGQGIARIMYDYAKELGYKILRSSEQTDAGAGFWDKHRGTQEVWEEKTEEIKSPGKLRTDDIDKNISSNQVHKKIRAQDFVTEYSDISPGIEKYLKKRGYRLLGQGVDQMAFLEPGTGHVLKIFGTQCDDNGGTPALSPDQKMFRFWANYCAKNQDNPYLPRIYGWETFVFNTYDDECLYLQIKTEKLSPIRGEFEDFFEEMANYAEQVSWEKFADDMSDDPYGPISLESWKKLTSDPASTKRIKKLYQTMAELAKIGRQRGYSWDLHSDNIMQRSDGTPVISDPWVI
jgi:ribosomal protein S18 acetylase RimI-like enzyme